MSAAPGIETPEPRPRQVGQSQRRPALALVPAGSARRRASRTPFAAVVAALLAAGLLGLLVLNTALAQDAFRLHALKQDSRALADREQLLVRQVEDLRAPQALAARAAELGMVQAGPPAFLRLPDGTVLGAETPAEAPEPLAEVEGGTSAPATGDAAAAPADAPAAEAPAAEAPAAEVPAAGAPAAQAPVAGAAGEQAAAPTSEEDE